jgi:hypothetical protein|nr:MAG TPA: hypothetical protein [Caudoviricetes sp.]
MDYSLEGLLEVLKSDCTAIEHALRQYCHFSADLIFGSFGAQGEREVDRREKVSRSRFTSS